MRWFGFIQILIFLCTLGVGTSAYSAGEATQVFNFEGKLTDNVGTPINVGTAVFTLQIYNPGLTCVLYEETQSINMVGSNGLFSVMVGSPTGAAKRSGDDPNHAVAHVFQNVSNISATNGGCGGGFYTPAIGDHRVLRVHVNDTGTGGSINEVIGDISIGAAPSAIVAESVQGLDRTKLLEIGAAAHANATQANFMSLINGSDVGSTLHNHDSHNDTRYAQLSNSGSMTMNNQSTFEFGDYTTAQETILKGGLGPADAGKTWYNSTTNKLMYWDGTTEQAVGTGGAPVTTVFGRAGAVAAATSDYDAIQIDNAAAGNIAATNVQAAIDELDTEKLALTGGTMSGALNMGTTNKITGLADATLGKDAANKDYVDGAITANNSSYVAKAGDNMSGALTLDAQNELRLADDTGGEYISFKSPTGLAGNFDYTLPGDYGTNTHVLTTDGSGGLTWTSKTTNTDTQNSLDGAYDEGGAGVGRSVTVDTGAIELQGSNAGDYTLEVSTTGNGGALEVVNSGGGMGFHLNNTGAGMAAQITNSGTSASLRVNDEGADSTPFVIDASGNVGVGTPGPLGKLHVSAGELVLEGTNAFFNYQPNNSECGNNEVLKWDATNDRWICGTDNAGGGSGTLDQAYDTGGAGSGRTVAVDSGAIQLVGSNAADETLEVSTSGNGGLALFENTGTGASFRVNDEAGDTSPFIIDSGGSVGVGEANPLTNTRLSINGVTAMRETATPTSDTNFGKIYVKSSDSNLYFLDDGGTEHQISGVASGGVTSVVAGAGITVSGSSAVTVGIANNGVTTTELAAGAVTANELGASAVTAVKIDDGAVTDGKISAVGVQKITSGAGHYFTYAPAGGVCSNDGVLKWSGTNNRWECGTDDDSGGDFLSTGSVPMTGNLRLNGHYLSNDGDAEGIFVAANGDVGINTATPSSDLQISNKFRVSAGGSDVQLQAIPSSAGGSAFTVALSVQELNPAKVIVAQSGTQPTGFSDNGSVEVVSASAAGGSDIVLRANDDIHFRSGSSQFTTPSETPTMVLTNDGRVGVGVDNPAHRFEIVDQLTGTVNVSATTLSGIGTFFQDELHIGEEITIGNETRTVISIGSQTDLTVATSFSVGGSGHIVKKKVFTASKSGLGGGAISSPSLFAYKTLTGTVGFSAGVTLNGSGANFNNEVFAGDEIIVNNQKRTVTSVSGPNTLTVDLPWSGSVSNEVAIKPIFSASGAGVGASSIGAKTMLSSHTVSGTASLSGRFVTGTSTAFDFELRRGDQVIINDELRTITNITGPGNLEVSEPFFSGGAGYSVSKVIFGAIGGTGVYADRVLTQSPYVFEALTGRLNSVSGITVNGSGTFFQTELEVGDALLIDGSSYEIANITSDTNLNLVEPVPTSRSDLPVHRAVTQVVRGTFSATRLHSGNIVSSENMSGTVTVSGSSVNGTSTSFLTELNSGDGIIVDGELRYIKSISSGSLLEVTQPFDDPSTNVSYRRVEMNKDHETTRIRNLEAGGFLVTQGMPGDVDVSASTVTGDGTNFFADFAVNDYIVIQGRPYRVTTVTSPTSLDVAGSFTSSDSDLPYYKARVYVKNDAGQTNMVVRGSVQFGDNTNPCNATREGAVRYKNGELQVCDGTAYIAVNRQMVAFRADMGGNLVSVSPSTTTVIDFRSVSINMGNAFSLATDRFQPTVPGMFLITCQATVSGLGANATQQVSIFKNNASHSKNVGAKVGGGASHVQTTALVQMNGTTDFLDFRYLHFGAGSLNYMAASDETYCQGHLVH